MTYTLYALGVIGATFLIIGLCVWDYRRYQARREAEAREHLRQYLASKTQTIVTPPPPRDEDFSRRGGHP